VTDDTLLGDVTLSPPKAYFVLFRADGSFGGLFPLHSGAQPVIGRHPSNAINLLDDQCCSLNHAVVRERDGGWTLCDLDSTNGTYVNQKRLDAHHPHQLQPLDQIRLGSHLFIFIHEVRQLPWLQELVERKSHAIPQSATLRSSAFGGPTVADFQLQDIAATIQKAVDRCRADGLS
jgi:pSer/pThr/pTyr-binding forkhead associated (FHA) protein